MVAPTHFKFNAFIAHIACIYGRGFAANLKRWGGIPNEKVFCFLVEIVDTEAQSTVEKVDIKADISLFRGLPLKVFVAQCGRTDPSNIVDSRGKWIESRLNHVRTIGISA